MINEYNDFISFLVFFKNNWIKKFKETNYIETVTLVIELFIFLDFLKTSGCSQQLVHTIVKSFNEAMKREFNSEQEQSKKIFNETTELLDKFLELFKTLKTDDQKEKLKELMRFLKEKGLLDG